MATLNPNINGTPTTSHNSPNNPFVEGQSPSNPRRREEGSTGLSSRLFKHSSNSSGDIDRAIGQSQPITMTNELDMQENIFIQNAQWIKQEDRNLEEMGYILGDLKNIAIATHTEVQSQSQKMDEIGASMERGSDFNLKKKSARQIKKEQKKAEKDEKERIKKEVLTKQDLDRRVETNLGYKSLDKDKVLNGPSGSPGGSAAIHMPGAVGNPFH
eukprot:gene12116-14174_t